MVRVELSKAVGFIFQMIKAAAHISDECTDNICNSTTLGPTSMCQTVSQIQIQCCL